MKKVIQISEEEIFEAMSDYIESKYNLKVTGDVFDIAYEVEDNRICFTSAQVEVNDFKESL